MSSVGALFSLLSYLYVMIRRFITVHWINLNLYATNFDRGPSTAYRHKVVIIGDSLGLGVGDWVIPGGTAGIANHVLNAIALEPGIRQRWFVYNRAVSGASSKDWLPPVGKGVPAGEVTGEDGSKGDALAAPTALGGKQYERVFGKGRASADAEIVVIMLGLSDVVQGEAGLPLQALSRGMGEQYTEQELAGYTKNVRALVAHLRTTLNKKVVLVDLPISGAYVGTVFGEGKMKRLNRQLRQVWKAATANGTKTDDYSFVPLGSNHKTVRSENRAFDGLHFNSSGYKLIANDVASVVKPMCVATEWATWKKELAKQAVTSEEIASEENKKER
jgi:lysophospholipase L1-like esterase